MPHVVAAQRPCHSCQLIQVPQHKVGSKRARETNRRTQSISTARAEKLGQPLTHIQQQQCIYLDYNATTPLFPECKAAIDKARQQVAKMVGADPSEVYFTASGSESDHWAIWGARTGKRSSAGQSVTPHVVTSAIEHPAVLQYLQSLAKEGLITFTAVEVDMAGVVHPQAIKAALTDATCLISIMHSNNEVGSIQPTQQIAQLASQHDVLMHSDAAQSIGKVPVDVKQLGVDLLTVVGHKFGAPKGVAALYIRQGVQLDNFFHGGGQEAGRRAGTENVLGIVGLGAAAELVTLEQEATAKHMAAMRDALQAQLAQAFPQDAVRMNGPADDHQRLPNTLSISIRGLRASELLADLNSELAASAGAACHSSQHATVSSVLQAMQLPEEYALGTLRLSTGRHTTAADIDRAAKLIIAVARKQGVKALRRNQQFRARLAPKTSAPHTEDVTAQPDHDRAVSNQQDTVSVAPTPRTLAGQHATAATPNSRAQEDTILSARRAEYHAWNTPGYQPATDTQDWSLSTWECAHVMDTGLEAHRARAQLDSGNAGRTLITMRFAKQLGLVDFDGNPTQSQARSERSVGVVYGATMEYKVNIQYEIKGKTVYSRAGVTEQGPNAQWDLLISRREIALFEADGFTFSTR